jgi:ABC-type glutathione transport system ATPase component
MPKKPSALIKIHKLNLVFGDEIFRLENINDIEIKQGEIVGILGESGCGKSTFGKCLIGLINHRDKSRFGISSLSDRDQKSNIEFLRYPQIFNSNNILDGTKKELLEFRKYTQMIFQQPRASLNMNMPARKILEESVRIGDPKIDSKSLEEKIKNLVDRFELGGSNWESLSKSKPKQLSGGERRRLGIAKVFAVDPDVIIADEPVASLDVSVRGKILKTIIQEWEDRYRLWELGKRDQPLTIIIISHDYNMIQRLAHKVLVFYGDVHVKRGTIVDLYSTEKTTNGNSQNIHPYSQKLKDDSNFMVDACKDKFDVDRINKPGKRNIINGCIYINNCPVAEDKCGNSEARDWNFSTKNMPCK